MKIEILKKLIEAHSTPGDEGEVTALLKSCWQENGLKVTELGKYAIFAEGERVPANVPTILVCAHMDSPGYIVETVEEDKLNLVTLGGASFEEEEAEVVVKTNQGKYNATLISPEERCFEASPVSEGVQPGDRACFAPNIEVEDNMIESPFLDNRLGCFLITELAKDHKFMNNEEFRVVLGATASEEMGGFGAPVLAHHVKPDYVIVLDATYTSEEQGISLGGGPVLTLSDNSVLLSPQERDEFAEMFKSAGIPYQFEVYNYSGTDSRAFPHAGLAAPVRSLLIPTENNHHRNEKAALIDIENTIDGVKLLARSMRGRPES